MRALIISIIFVLLTFSFSQADENIVIVGLFKNKVIFKLNNKQHVLSTGESVGNEIMLISANSKEAIFNINGQEHRYTLDGHIGSSYNKASPSNIVTIAPDSNGMYFVYGGINKHQTRFLVDTGATLISMNRNEANRFGIDYKLIGQKAMTTTASGTETVYIVNLKSVRIGDIQLNNISAAVHDGDYPDIILLGNSFLNRVSIRRDGQLLKLSN